MPYVWCANLYKDFHGGRTSCEVEEHAVPGAVPPRVRGFRFNPTLVRFQQ
ncbi:MAG: hypothetical protein ACP5G6_09160 [Conexivisphaera sp.]